MKLGQSLLPYLFAIPLAFATSCSTTEEPTAPEQEASKTCPPKRCQPCPCDPTPCPPKSPCPPKRTCRPCCQLDSFPSGSLEVSEEQIKALAGFTGTWKVTNRDGSQSYITLEVDGVSYQTISSTNDHQGTWELAPGGVKICWNDGWTDILLIDGDQGQKASFAPGTYRAPAAAVGKAAELAAGSGHVEPLSCEQIERVSKEAYATVYEITPQNESLQEGLNKPLLGRSQKRLRKR